MLERLKEIGLTDKEIIVLKSLIEDGESTIVQLSRKTNISRSYCYEALDNLMKKGFITKVILNKKTIWKSNPIERIIDYINFLKEEIKQELSRLPKREKESEEVKINLYKGTKGIRVVCDRELESKTNVIGWGAEGQLEKYMPFYYKHFKDECIKRRLKANFIIMKPLSKLASKNVNFKHFSKHFDTFVEVNVFDDRTLIFFWKKEPEAIEIVSKNVADSFRNYHKFFWKKLG